MLSNYEYAKMLQKIADKRELLIDDECLLAVQAQNRMCLCQPTKRCPCASITDAGCACGLFIPKEAV